MSSNIVSEWLAKAQTPILFTSDVHGNNEQYVRIVDFCTKHKIPTLLLGGDISPKCQFMREKDYYGMMQRGQAAWIKTEFPKLLTPLKDLKTKVYLCLGNGDVSANYKLHLENEKNGFYTLVDNKRVDLGNGFDLVGYPYCPFSFSSMKDFEKFDTLPRPNTRHHGQHSNSCLSTIPQRRFFTFEEDARLPQKWEKYDLNSSVHAINNIETDLLDPTFLQNPQKTDVIPKKEHVGSVAIREFIETRNPYLTLHGHIHECVEVTNQFVGTPFPKAKTVVVASGNDPLYQNSYPHGKTPWVVLIDLQDPKSAARILLD